MSLFRILTVAFHKQGGTEFAGEGMPPPGSAYYFDGKVSHRGTGNESGENRYVLMAVIASNKDKNRNLSENPIFITKESNDASTKSDEPPVSRKRKYTHTTGLFAYHHRHSMDTLW